MDRLPTYRALALTVGLLLLAGPARAGLDTLTVERRDEPRLFVTDGVIEAVDQGTVAAQTSGRVVALNVDVNDRVDAGKVLLEISSEQQSAGVDAQRAALAQAQAQQQEAQANLERVKGLMASGSVSKSAYDTALANAKIAESTVARLEASLRGAREGLGYTRILAPYSGVVTARHVELGETVTVGQPLLSGHNLDRLRVVAELPQRVASQVVEGQAIEVTLADGTRLSSDDHLLFNYADATSHSVKLRVNHKPDLRTRLIPGGWAKLAITTGTDQVLRIPRTAVLRKHELSAVYIALEQGKWQLRPVRLGDERDGQVAILAGLDEGEVIARDAYDVVTAYGGQYAP